MKVFIVQHTQYYDQPQANGNYSNHLDPVVLRSKQAVLDHIQATKRPNSDFLTETKADIRKWLEYDNAQRLYVTARQEGGPIEDYDLYTIRTATLKD